MDNQISPEKTEAIKKEYDASPWKGIKNIKEYIIDKAFADNTFVPLLFNFEQGEDFDNALTQVHRDAFSAWVDTFDNY